MKFKRLVVLIFAAILCLFVVGCENAKDNHEGKVKIVFELEGGTYRNSKKPVVHYYNLKEDASEIKILDLESATKNPIAKANFKLKGWYRDRVELDGKVSYANPFDFENEKVSKEGITLYAYWIPNATYKYDLCYMDENNEKQVLVSYEVNEGEVFNDHKHKANSRFGYTAINIVDKDGNNWDPNFKHPGGDHDLTIDVFVEYIKGDYEVVRTASELKKAKKSNIYLVNDIDMNGDTLSFNGYNKHFIGNGHTISNFYIDYNARRDGLIEDFDEPTKQSLAISLFGNIKDAIIEDVHFENVKVDVLTKLTTTFKIYVSPLATEAVNSTIKNVTFNGTYECSELPKGFIPENLIYITDRPAYKFDESFKAENINVSVTVK